MSLKVIMARFALDLMWVASLLLLLSRTMHMHPRSKQSKDG